MTTETTARDRGTSSRGRDAGDRSAEGGFALALALIVLVGITVFSTAGVWMARSEMETSGNQRASFRAFQMAEAGMSRFLGEAAGIPSPSRTYTFPDGTADVTTERLGVFAGGHEMYRVTSEATLDDPVGTERTVSNVTMLDPLQLEFPAGLSTANNIQKSGTAGLISGFDAATSSDCPEAPQPDKPGVIAEDYTQSGGGGGGGGAGCSGPICGDPPVAEVSDPLSTLTFDWQEVLDGAVLEYDYTLSGTAGWPSYGADEWPVILVSNGTDPSDEIALSDAAGHSGRGILVIQGDVVMQGDWHWDGVVLVGGSLTSDGNNVITGATVAGLNELIGGDPALIDLGNGNKTFQYHSCNILRATKEAGRLYEVPGSWRESL